MSRTAPRLRLELWEDRSLPAAGLYVNTPPIDPAQLSHRAAGAEPDDDAEYATASQPGSKTSPADAAYAQVVAYIAETYPAIPPTPASPAPPSPAALPGTPTATPAPVVTAVPVPPPPAPAPTPTPPAQAAVPPAGDDADDGAEEPPPTPPAPAEDPPVVSDTAFSPAGLVNFPPLDDPSLRADVGRWAASVGRLLDGLDVGAGLPDAESPWARLGYWALTVGAVGVSVELTRQGLRARRPEPVDGPPLPVAR